MQSATTGWFY